MINEISVRIAYAQIPLINAHADVSSKAIGLFFFLSDSSFILIHALRMRVVEALVSLVDSHEQSLLADAISTEITRTGQYYAISYAKHRITKS